VFSRDVTRAQKSCADLSGPGLSMLAQARARTGGAAARAAGAVLLRRDDLAERAAGHHSACGLGAGLTA